MSVDDSLMCSFSILRGNADPSNGSSATGNDNGLRAKTPPTSNPKH